MSTKPNKIKTFIKVLPKKFFWFCDESYYVANSLGLAMASEATSIAGLIAAVVGGNNATIVGPGNGLVGVLLVAITTLGLESAYAAIILFWKTFETGGLFVIIHLFVSLYYNKVVSNFFLKV